MSSVVSKGNTQDSHHEGRDRYMLGEISQSLKGSGGVGRVLFSWELWKHIKKISKSGCCWSWSLKERLGFDEKFLEKHIPEGEYSRREATSQKMDEIKYLLLLPVSWNKKLLSLTVAWMGQVA